MKHELTPWFPASVKPVRLGVYQRISKRGIFFSYWNGSQWSVGVFWEEFAALKTSPPSLFQRRRWRGLTNPGESNG